MQTPCTDFWSGKAIDLIANVAFQRYIFPLVLFLKFNVLNFCEIGNQRPLKWLVSERAMNYFLVFSKSDIYDRKDYVTWFWWVTGNRIHSPLAALNSGRQSRAGFPTEPGYSPLHSLTQGKEISIQQLE